MIPMLTVSLAADDTGAAILHSNSGVLLNGSAAPTSSALFPGDTIETHSTAVARIDATGSMIDINPETVVQFESDEVHLDHGSVSVNTSRGFKVRVGCVLVVPVNDAEWTRYNVTDTDGKVTVAALKNDVNIDSRPANPIQTKRSAGSGRVTVREGEQKSREEKCGTADQKWSDAIAAKGAIMNSPYVLWPAAGVIGAGTLCILFCFNNNPISPSNPSSPATSGTNSGH
jgi:hypothetical protein